VQDADEPVGEGAPYDENRAWHTNNNEINSSLDRFQSWEV
jgi:hypothetical protein